MVGLSCPLSMGVGVDVGVGVGVKLIIWIFYPAHQWHTGSTRFLDCALGSLQGNPA